MKRKIVASLLGLCIIATALVGCGKEEESFNVSSSVVETKEEVSKPEPAPAPTVEVEEEVVEETEAVEETEVVEEDTSTYEAVTIRVGYMPNYGSLWSIESAIAQNLFDENVTIEMHEFPDGPSIIAELEAGNLDVGYIGQGAHKHVINKGLRIFALSHVANADMIISKDDIAGILDLSGKTIGYVPETSSEVILKAALESEGLTMDDVTLKTVEDCGTATLEEALASGKVDAVSVWSPDSLSILENVEGIKELADDMSVPGMPLPLSSWICTADFADNNMTTLTRFANGLFKGMSYGAKENQDVVAGYVADRVGVEQEMAYAQRGDAQWYTAEDIVTGIENGTIESYYKMQQEVFIANGDVQETPVSDYVMLDFMGTIAK